MATIREHALVSRVRQRADMENNFFISDLEIQTYLNAGLCELHDILIQTYGQDYYIKSTEWNTTAGTDTYLIFNLANDFYKLRGIDCKLNGQEWFTLRPFNFNERNLYQNWAQWSVLGLSNIRYRMVGGNFVFTPVPNAVTAMRIWYIPTAQQFESAAPGTSTAIFDDINGYAEYVVIDAAIKCLQKEESDVQVLMAQKLAMKKRI